MHQYAALLLVEMTKIADWLKQLLTRLSIKHLSLIPNIWICCYDTKAHFEIKENFQGRAPKFAMCSTFALGLVKNFRFASAFQG